MLQSNGAWYRKLLPGILLLMIAVSSVVAAQVYGVGVEVEESTPIHEILADPDAYLGQVVRVDGQVLDVCPRKGCWIELGDDSASMQIKVDDDVIVFSSNANGRVAAAQGRVEAVEMGREEYLRYLAHLAAERGDDFDAETAEIGPGPYRLIRIRGTGARIE
jgi:hypothetical protein